MHGFGCGDRLGSYRFFELYGGERSDLGQGSFLLLLLLFFGLDELLHIKRKFKQPLLQFLLLLHNRILFFLVQQLVVLITGPQYHLFLGKDELDVGLLDLVLGQEVDLMYEIQPNCSLEVLPLQRCFILFIKTRMQVVVFDEVVPDDEDAIVAGPS